jgi:glucosylceramidase
MRPLSVFVVALAGCSLPSSPGDMGDAANGDVLASDGGSKPPSDDGGGSDAAVVDASPPPAPAAYVTTDDLTMGLAPVAIRMGSSGAADATITIDTSTTYQTMLGFGASITDSSSDVMTRYLSAAALARVLTKLFDPTDGVGLSFLRQPIGASDFSSVGNFSYDEGASDPTLSRFNIDQDMKATIPILKRVLAMNPAMIILGTPWSPPAWMKNNGSMNGTGGHGGSSGLAGDAYGPFGKYLVKFVQAYAKQGIRIDAITPQNEPLNGAAAYPGMDLDAPSETALIAEDIGPSLRAAGLSTLVWAYDHNWDVESYPEHVVADPVASGFTEGAAFHCYGGDPSAMTTFHDHYPLKSVYMTECSGGDWQTDPFAATIDLVIDSTANFARAIALWNMALDENNGPKNTGCSTCRGVITIDSRSGNVTYNADYFALGHFSKWVRRGAVRIASTSSSALVKQVAFENTDGRLAVVAHNKGSSTLRVRVETGANAMTVEVPANAAVTLSWSR